MTARLYYENSYLFNFTASLESVRELAGGRRALLLDQSAFYPTGGGQPCDTGWIELVAAELEGADGQSGLGPGFNTGSNTGFNTGFNRTLRVSEVIEDESSGELLHVVESLAMPASLPLCVRGFIDVDRRQDHMQQHSGRHILSAVFRKLFHAETLAFQLDEECSSIDLEIESLTTAQIEQAERYANQFVWDDRQVLTHEVTRAQAERLSIRNLSEAEQKGLPPETVRLIEIRGMDVCACGGTHVKTSGQIGNIQLREVEAIEVVRAGQGIRVAFACGARALRFARREYQLLADAAVHRAGGAPQ